MKTVARLPGAYLALLAVSTLQAAGQTATPIAHWSFDESGGQVVRDQYGHADGELSGIYRRAHGVSGNALRMDGETSTMKIPSASFPSLGQAFTLEGWVAVNTYPWNWVPILDQQEGESAGLFFGIDSFGHLGLQLAVDGKWQFLTSKEQLPLKTWSHVAATFDSNGISIFLNGKLVAHRSVHGSFTAAPNQDVLVGRTRTAMLPEQWIHPRYPVLYSFDGLLDELSIWNQSLSADQIDAGYSHVTAPEGEVLSYPVMPSGPVGPGPFGAYYATLKYDELWDAPRRVGRDSDVVVRFDNAPIRLVSWQGTNYIPAWVTENGKWYSDEFVETGGAPGCPGGEDCEPMSDKQNRYAHVRVLESTPARAVIHFRYGLCEVERLECANPDPITGWADWADEYYTIYPDGVAARKQVAWTTNFKTWHEFQETIIINQAGTRPEDNIEINALTFANMRGDTKTYSWEKPPVSISQPENANIQMVNLKSHWKPFQIVMPDHPLISTYFGEKSHSIVEWWNHWPVAQVKSSGISAVAPDRPSHSSLSHIEGQPYEQTSNSITKIMLDGLTDQPASSLALLAKSWVTPAEMEVIGSAFHTEKYDPSQRAFLVTRTSTTTPSGALRITFKASDASPLLNPCIIVRNWGDAKPRLTIDGKPMEWSKDYRFGIVPEIDGSNLVVWLRIQSQTTVRIELAERPD